MATYKKEFIRDNFVKAIGAEIAGLRRQKSLTGTELGSLVGLSQQQISRYENGVCEITTSTLCALLYHLDISLGIFFYRVALRLERSESSFYVGFESLFEHLELHHAKILSNDIYAYLQKKKQTQKINQRVSQ